MSTPQDKKPIPAPGHIEEAIDGFASLPMAEIAARAKAASVPPDVMVKAWAKLRESAH